MSGCLILDGRQFQSRGVAAANVLSPKELCVRPTTSVRVSAERNRLDTGLGDESAVVSQVARYVAGQNQRGDRGDLPHRKAEASAAGEAPVKCGRIVACPAVISLAAAFCVLVLFFNFSSHEDLWTLSSTSNLTMSHIRDC